MRIEKDDSLCDSMNHISLKILDYGHAYAGREWNGSLVNPPHTRLYYIIEGDPYITIDGERQPLSSGHCYLLPTGCSLCYGCESKMEQLYFHLNLLDYNGIDLLRSCRNIIEYTPDKAEIETLTALLHEHDLFSGLLIRQKVGDSLYTLLRLGNVTLESTHYSRCVRLAIEYIRSHLSMQLAVSEIAASAFVSESTLSKRFKAEVGMTIGSYIDDTVMFEAEQLLCKSELTVLQISERFGYCDQFYFSRRFKSRYGETPQKYRRMKPI